MTQPTVAKVSKVLLAADLVETQRGVRGGYRLEKFLANISLIDVVEAMEGPIAVPDCGDETHGSGTAGCCCFMRSHLNHVNLAIRKALMDVTLEDVINPAQTFPLQEKLQVSLDNQQLGTQ